MAFNSSVRTFLTVIISMEARDVISSWASLGMQIRGSASSRGGRQDTQAGGLNLSSSSGI